MHYVPIDQARDKLWRWRDHGTQIAYLGPSRRPEDIAKNERLLRQLDFSPGPLHHRGSSETYAEEVERISPTVFVEDDCASIGGKQEMASPHLSASARAQISCIVVPEFGGMDHLPDDPAERAEWSQTHPWPAS